MRHHFHRITALLLAAIMTFALIPSAQAAQSITAAPGDPGSATDRYVNEADGQEIAAAQTVITSEKKNPQTIRGYEYSTFSEELCCKGWMSNPLLNSMATAPSVAV